MLREAGWVRSERRASFIYYRLDPAAVARFRAIAGEFAPALNRPSARSVPVFEPRALPSA